MGPQGDVARRLRAAARGLGCSSAELVALALLVTGALAVLGLLWLTSRPAPAGVVAVAGSPPPDALALRREPVPSELVVHVAGAVVRPGVYRLPPGARIADALAAAGGPAPDAVLDAVNLARPVQDGGQLLIPDASATVPAGDRNSGEGPAPGGGGGAWRPDGTLDLNLATAADLEELPGIGPVLAERIVSHREATGGFTEIGQLREVPGIGEKTFQSVAPLVTVEGRP